MGLRRGTDRDAEPLPPGTTPAGERPGQPEEAPAGERAGRPEEAPALSVRGLSVSYGEVAALRDVSFDLTSHRVTALLGMNGSGKSSLFNAVSGFIRPDAGEVRVLGMSAARARRSNLVGYMPQSEAVDWGFPISVREVVMMGRYGYMGPGRHPRRQDREAVAAALERVGLTEFAHRQIGQLSGGQRKRAFLARSIAQGARLLLLDEPLAGVDRVSTRTIADLLKSLAAEGVTVLISVHEIGTLAELAEEAILLRRRVVYRGTAEDVLKPEHLALAFGDDADAGAGTEEE
ncbi:metal ABC transporter ATP-binding protein [Rothia sp. AR01]|uniref:Metal ABC transporter ATP-binding protein n=1 Tax=Rothia santali TaxID=2949643 RepID=A0A9X2KJ60_9MICC|nr:metal ABC transporter ATP-binding protein [Rothia santali]MCP3426908.1 metal ABC transporter ATP-binding protein [Rothia santali]